jgi:hypothetical protein
MLLIWLWCNCNAIHCSVIACVICDTGNTFRLAVVTSTAFSLQAMTCNILPALCYGHVSVELTLTIICVLNAHYNICYLTAVFTAVITLFLISTNSRLFFKHCVALASSQVSPSTPISLNQWALQFANCVLHTCNAMSILWNVISSDTRACHVSGLLFACVTLSQVAFFSGSLHHENSQQKTGLNVLRAWGKCTKQLASQCVLSP